MKDKKTGVLLIGFGGPTRPEEVKPFLDSILAGSNIPQARWNEVLHHYKTLSGVSPFNELTFQQKAALEKHLKTQGIDLPVGVAFRHSQPGFQDAFETFNKHGVERVVGFILASFRSFVSRQWYIDKAEEGRKPGGAQGIGVVYAEPFEADPLYLDAQADQARKLWEAFSPSERASCMTIFTAHSIPLSMCEVSTGENRGRCYGSQFQEASRGIAQRLGLKEWTACYQSRTGDPRSLWLEPDIKGVIASLDPKFKRVLVIPVGFLCDNAEVIYDLDVDAKAACDRRSIAYHRASPVADHPKFIELMARLVLEKV